MKLDDPIHPGEHLAEFLEEKNFSVESFAEVTGLSDTHVREILCGERPVTVDAAKRIGRALNTSAIMWLRIQRFYDLEVAHGYLKVEWIDEVRAITLEDFEKMDSTRLTAHAIV